MIMPQREPLYPVTMQIIRIQSPVRHARSFNWKPELEAPENSECFAVVPKATEVKEEKEMGNVSHTCDSVIYSLV